MVVVVLSLANLFRFLHLVWALYAAGRASKRHRFKALSLLAAFGTRTGADLTNIAETKNNMHSLGRQPGL